MRSADTGQDNINQQSRWQLEYCINYNYIDNCDIVSYHGNKLLQTSQWNMLAHRN